MNIYLKTLKINDSFCSTVDIYKNNADNVGCPYYEVYMNFLTSDKVLQLRIAKATYFYDGELMYDFSYLHSFLNLKISSDYTDNFISYTQSIEFDNLQKKISKAIKNLYKKDLKRIAA